MIIPGIYVYLVKSTITINNDTSVFEAINNKQSHEIFFKIENTKLPYDS